MAGKNKFTIAPKLKETPKELKALPVQDISPEEIQKIAGGGEGEKQVQEPVSRPIKKEPKQTKKPQGRPRREEPVKRLSSDLPAELYDKVKQEVSQNGYTLNGFLAKIIREYFERKDV